eukprot:7099358-Prymnesium_polylepis.1
MYIQDYNQAGLQQGGPEGDDGVCADPEAQHWTKLCLRAATRGRARCGALRPHSRHYGGFDS